MNEFCDIVHRWRLTRYSEQPKTIMSFIRFSFIIFTIRNRMKKIPKIKFNHFVIRSSIHTENTLQLEDDRWAPVVEHRRNLRNMCWLIQKLNLVIYPSKFNRMNICLKWLIDDVLSRYQSMCISFSNLVIIVEFSLLVEVLDWMPLSFELQKNELISFKTKSLSRFIDQYNWSVDFHEKNSWIIISDIWCFISSSNMSIRILWMSVTNICRQTSFLSR